MYKLNELKIGGFATSSANEGENFYVLQKSWATSEDPKFYIYAEQIGNMVFIPLGIPKESVKRAIIVVHSDNTVDVYVNDFQEKAQVQVINAVAAGEAVYSKNVKNIKSIEFPEIVILETDKIIYYDQAGFRHGIFFNLTGSLNIEQVGYDIARLKRSLLLEDIVALITSEIGNIENEELFIITEGKTDVIHLAKAFSKLNYNQNIKYEESAIDRGDTELLAICKHLSLEPRARPVICIFDRDNPEIVKALRGQSGGVDTEFQSWGNNVYSFMIPLPPHRKQNKNLSIEMYYADEYLSIKDEAGKKLYFDNEYKKEILPGQKMPKYIAVPPVKALELTKKICDFADSVEDENGNKVAFSKTAYAKNIAEGKEPFDKIDFSNFSLIMEVLEKIRKQVEG